MSDFLSYLHQTSRYSHIILGFVGLVLFWVPVVAYKGGRVHRLAGKLFAAIAMWVGLTGFFASLWAIADPIGFTASLGRTVPDHVVPRISEQIRFGFGFLAFLSIATVSGVVLGVATAWTKTRHEQLRSLWVTGPLLFMGLTALLLLANGVWNLWLGFRGEHLLSGGAFQRYWVHVVLGLIGVLGGWSDWNYIRTTPTCRRAWYYKHMECMLGTGIAFYTAFLVFGANRLFEGLAFKLEGGWAYVPWVLPSLIGLPLIARWQKQMKRKFGDLPEGQTVPPRGEMVQV